jgi:primosomal replication protein N
LSAGTQSTNRVELEGTLAERGTLRHTPAGVPVIEFRIAHQSENPEAGARRKVRAEVPALAFEATARLIAAQALGTRIKASGFLCARSQRSKALVMHVNEIEFMQGE